MDARLGRVVRDLRDKCKEKVGEPYPPSSEPFSPPHKRTGGLQKAIFAARIGSMDWAFGVKKVAPDPARPSSNREDLGLWLELGTGEHRLPLPAGSSGTVPPISGERTSMYPRPYLLVTLLENRDNVAEDLFRGGGARI